MERCVYYEGYSLRASFSIGSAFKDVEAKFVTKLNAVTLTIFNGSYCCACNLLMLISVSFLPKKKIVSEFPCPI
jgi:hypothetical protein